MFRCHVCGEEVLSRETTERVRVMLYREDEPIRSISLDVFSYSDLNS